MSEWDFDNLNSMCDRTAEFEGIVQAIAPSAAPARNDQPAFGQISNTTPLSDFSKAVFAISRDFEKPRRRIEKITKLVEQRALYYNAHQILAPEKYHSIVAKEAAWGASGRRVRLSCQIHEKVHGKCDKETIRCCESESRTSDPFRSRKITTKEELGIGITAFQLCGSCGFVPKGCK
jgi:hypothetical protein